ncbi:MAG: hypothetical protein MZU97_20570 [Bacillus subtilis]|nr:hypothetical protein [Bacillus subtilis]
MIRCFLNTTGLSDGTATLELWEVVEANPLKAHLPSYRFRILETATGIHVGRLNFRIGTAKQVYLFGHIGYEIYPEYRGHRLAYHACVAAMELAATTRNEGNHHHVQSRQHRFAADLGTPRRDFD